MDLKKRLDSKHRWNSGKYLDPEEREDCNQDDIELSRWDVWMHRCKDARMRGCIGSGALQKFFMREQVERAG